MAQYMYGIKTNNGEHIDVSKTERGAKNYATRNGYNWITRRDVMRGYVETVAVKSNNRWIASF